MYDPTADHSTPAPPVYNRIGNDTEQIVFFGKSNDRFARALLPLIDSPDPELSRLAAEASLLCRSVSFPGVNETAGKAGSDRDQLVSAVLAKPVPADIVKAFRPKSRGGSRHPDAREIAEDRRLQAAGLRPTSAPTSSRF